MLHMFILRIRSLQSFIPSVKSLTCNLSLKGIICNSPRICRSVSTAMLPEASFSVKSISYDKVLPGYGSLYQPKFFPRPWKIYVSVKGIACSCPRIRHIFVLTSSLAAPARQEPFSSSSRRPQPIHHTHAGLSLRPLPLSLILCL